ncbi:MAG: hypothetical protein JWO81_2251 [Alphaproteobacteria bacterium]|nr:hypothetical protein [Alphaproteobacteria bacterium]
MIACIAILLAAWGVVWTSAVNAEEDNPFAAARVAPSDPRVRIGIAMVYFDLHGGRVPDEQRLAALHALKQEPLADEPFLLAAVPALAAGNGAEGERLLLEARRRNPRLRMARLLLLDRYLRTGRIGDAALEMASLDRLIGGAGAVLVPAMAQMVQDPQLGPKMIPIIASERDLQHAVLQSLAASDADAGLILRVAGDSGLRMADAKDWQGPLLSRLVDRGDLLAALHLWRRFAGDRDASDEKGLYDARFDGLRGPPPFNWILASGGAGAAERNRNGGLQVDYYGRQEGDLARQLLMLKPGRYRFSFTAEGGARGEGSRLIWTLGCQRETQLLQLVLKDVASSPKRFAGTFTVPATGCPAQWLTLQGLSGDVASDQSVTIAGLSLIREPSS